MNETLFVSQQGAGTAGVHVGDVLLHMGFAKRLKKVQSLNMYEVLQYFSSVLYFQDVFAVLAVDMKENEVFVVTNRSSVGWVRLLKHEIEVIREAM